MAFWNWVKTGLTALAAAVGTTAGIALAATGVGAPLGAAIGALSATLLLPRYIDGEAERKKREEEIQREKVELEKKNHDDIAKTLEGVHNNLLEAEGLYEQASKNKIPEEKQEEAFKRVQDVIAETRKTLQAWEGADISDKEAYESSISNFFRRLESLSDRFSGLVEPEIKKLLKDAFDEEEKVSQELISEASGLK